MHMQNRDICLSYMFLTKRNFAHYNKAYVKLVAVALSPVVCSSETSLHNRG
jgi:hypothetical protein